MFEKRCTEIKSCLKKKSSTKKRDGFLMEIIFFTIIKLIYVKSTCIVKIIILIIFSIFEILQKSKKFFFSRNRFKTFF